MKIANQKMKKIICIETVVMTILALVCINSSMAQDEEIRPEDNIIEQDEYGAEAGYLSYEQQFGDGEMFGVETESNEEWYDPTDWFDETEMYGDYDNLSDPDDEWYQADDWFNDGEDDVYYDGDDLFNEDYFETYDYDDSGLYGDDNLYDDEYFNNYEYDYEYMNDIGTLEED